MNTERIKEMDLFAEEVKSELEKMFGGGYRITIHRVVKNNGRIRTGVTVQKDGRNTAPMLYLDNAWMEYQNGRIIESICEELVHIYHAQKLDKDFDVDFMMDYAKVKDRICFKLVNAERNQEMLQDVPHIRVQDLAVIFFIPVMDIADAMGSITVKKNLQDIWGVDTDTLYKQAMDNTRQIFGSKINSMLDELIDISGRNAGDDMLGEEFAMAEAAGDIIPMYVCTNTKKCNGAGVFLYDGLLRDFADSLGKDLYILPSSIHETLFVPVGANVDAEKLKEMVKEVNATMVEPEEILSDNVYYYSRSLDSVKMLMSA